MVKLFVLQTSVFIIKIIHTNNMVIIFNIKQQNELDTEETGSLTHRIDKCQRPFLREEKCG